MLICHANKMTTILLCAVLLGTIRTYVHLIQLGGRYHFLENNTAWSPWSQFQFHSLFGELLGNLYLI